ncbi:hypothetical protein Tco_1018140 [Tanacetum coccineum]|uniref:Uncharacterized protein n=1 Tax=Tanacetum coccineum TaxID=301880 RepID=A0ABQ5FUW6_9ASTR
MVAYLEKTDGNAEFHEIIDFLTRSSIHYALTVSLVVSTTFVEQFWMTAKSKTINNVRYITATVAGKPVSISEASIRNRFPINALTTKVFSFMVKKGKKKSGNVTPLFPSMLAQPTEDEGAVSENLLLLTQFLTPFQKVLVGIMEVTTQAAQIKDLKTQIKQLKKKAKPIISHHNAWIKSVSLKKRLARKKSLKTKLMQKESVSKQGRKPAKSEPTVHKDPDFDDLDDAMDYIETEDAHDEGTVKDGEETRVSTEDQVSTDRPKVSIDKLKVSTDKPNKGTAEPDEGTAKPKDRISDESAAPITVFRDDETIAQFLVTMSQNKTKEKGFEIKEIKDTDRPRTTTERSILTLKPLPKIDPKDKGKKVLEEKAKSYAESKARIEADSILAARLQEEEREKFIIKERVKLLHDTIAAQRWFLAQQRATEIRSRPPTRTQLRNQMMTYLKHVGGKKHSDLKNKFFEEIKVLYEKVKSYDENFVAIGSAKDERIIRELNKKGAGTKKANNIKEESKEEAGTRKRKLGTRKKMKSRKKRFRHGTSEDKKENDELKLCLTIAPDEDKEFDETKGLEESNLNVVIRSNGQRRYFSTLMRVLSIFDKEDLNVVYKLVMDRYQNEVPESFDRVFWGDLIIMFNPNDEDEIGHSYACREKVSFEKESLSQCWNLKLESEEDSTMALELIRFVKKLIAELEHEDSNGNEEDL